MAFMCWVASLTVPAAARAADDVTEIAFGSCNRQHRSSPVFDTILADEPDAFLFMGDNVYADFFGTPAVPLTFWLAYGQLAARPEYQRLTARVPIHATWDDHDFGINDGGSDYPGKAVAKAFFVDFFGFPPDHPIHGREGVYHAEMLGRGDRIVQVIFLDTRSFRSPLTTAEPTDECPVKNLLPNDDPEATLLGEAQWRWLEDQLRTPAAIRLLVSSIQVIPAAHCFEKWANFPHERERLLALLQRYGIDNLVILSGDRHFGEISRLDPPDGGPVLYEITASGLNTAGTGRPESNPWRVSGGRVEADHYGRIRIDWQARTLALELVDANREVRETQALEIP